jgi:GMP synthase (glutamine-hydrolysing)
MRPIVILMMGTTAVPERGDFDRLIVETAGLAAARVQVLDVAGGAPLPDPARAGAVILTGSAAMVTQRQEWSERTAAWLPSVLAAKTPLLGICYGHQLLAHALGGTVGRNPRGREIGTATVTLAPAAAADPLFEGLPGELHVQESHVESVLVPPPGARVLAGNAVDPHQALAIGERAWTTQFHPEFDADITRGYLRTRGEILRAEGLDPARLTAATRDSTHGTTVLRRFIALADGANVARP